jgi:hypothetical protein
LQGVLFLENELFFKKQQIMSGRGFTSEVSSAIGMNIEIEIDGETKWNTSSTQIKQPVTSLFVMMFHVERHLFS